MPRPAVVLAAAAALAAALFSRFAAATPLDLHRVPAGAAGLVHIDADALRKASFYQPLQIGQAVSGVDPAIRPLVETVVTSCRAITVWFDDDGKGKGDEAVDEAVVAEFPGAPQAGSVVTSIAKLTKAKDVGGGHYVGKTDDGNFDMIAVGNLVVFAKRQASLDKTVAVLRGKAPALSPKALPAGTGTHGVFLFVALGNRLLDTIKHSADSALLKTDITSLAIDVAEVGPDLRATAVAVMSTADGAQKVKSVIDGLIALAGLSDEIKLPQPLDHYVQVKVSGTQVELDGTIPAAELVKLIQDAKAPKKP